MPTISTFYGIVIRMFFNDHPPAHFHALYGEFHATIEIEGPRILEGELPRRATELVPEWARPHKAELLEGRRRCRGHEHPHKIEPLS